jgi:hypothetical protein
VGDSPGRFTSSAPDVRRAFFKELTDAQKAVGTRRSRPGRADIFVNIPTVEHLHEYVRYVGSFLVISGVISNQDLGVAFAMVEDYEDRLQS